MKSLFKFSYMQQVLEQKLMLDFHLELSTISEA